MGFIGMNETSVSIHSRFTHKNKQGVADDEGKDFFLYYMLQKVFVVPFKIPQKADNWKDFLQGINQSESRLKDTLTSR